MRDLWPERGETFLADGKFAAAVKEFGRALAQNPGNAALLLRVSECAFLTGKTKESARAAKRAHEIAGGPDFLRRRLQAELISGDETSAKKTLALQGLPEGEVLFWRAVLSCRAGKWNDGHRLFLKSVMPDPIRLAVRAGLLAAWAAHRAAGTEPAPRGRGVVIAGLGWKRPRQATVGALDALSSCAKLIVVANTLDDDTRDLLCLFRAKISAVAFRGSEAEAAKAAGQALDAARKGRAGTVTRGNPLVYGRFAARLVAGGAARAIPVEVFPGVSAFEGLAAAERPSPRAALGFELRDSFSAGDADPARPLIVFTPSAAPGRRALGRKLPGLAAGRPVLLLTSEGSSAAEPVRLSAREAAAALRASPAPAMLLVPSRRSRS